MQVAEKFGRYEGTDGHITLGDTDSTVITFSGRPDMIRMLAHNNSAEVKLTDRLNRELHTIHVHSGTEVVVRIGRERVVAKNAAQGANCQLAVTGFWADPDESIHGRLPFRA